VNVRPSSQFLEALAVAAPGRPLREGVDRILQSGKGALIIVGDGPEVLNVCSGGFRLDAAFSPQRLSELAKMDGAIVLSSDQHRIAWANVHLVPDTDTPTSETGTRHRTAERVARSIKVPVISVSSSMEVITIYVGPEKHTVQPVARIMGRANQALQTLERYQTRLAAVSMALSALEIQDLVTLRDVVSVLQRAEMAQRIGTEIEAYNIELGIEGRLLRLQLKEVQGATEQERLLVIRDYLCADPFRHLDQAVQVLESIHTDDLLSFRGMAKVLQIGDRTGDLDQALEPRGFRLLARLPILTGSEREAIVARYQSLPRILRATESDLADLLDHDRGRAQAVKDGLARLAESSIIDRYA